ncbi:MAG: hypothetical protein AB7S57_24535, partial [Acetobacteraceae bacterium]
MPPESPPPGTVRHPSIAERRQGRGAPSPWPITARTETRRGRLREVGARLFATRGVDRVSMLEVAFTAEVSP